MSERWFHLPVNPEPWAVGSLGVGRRGGKYFPTMSPNAQLVAFKEAVAEELVHHEPLPPGEYELEFFFWRRLDDYETASGRRHRKHQADTTNLQKATEDALQGHLIGNDRDVRDVRSTIVEQGKGVNPAIIIRAAEWTGLDPERIPQFMWDKLDNVVALPTVNSNQWPPPGGVF